MCGIFGAINKRESFNREHYLKFIQLTDSVAYRGPDSSGYKAINTRTNRIDENCFNVFLGHRRLSIIDLSNDGNQPMSIDKFHLIYNGEIFNYIEIREELKNEGVNFISESDTEVIIKLYEKHSEKSFDKLNGMWAFILVDTRNNKVIISRDRFSIKPLFLYESDHAIYFSSEIKQLLPLLESIEVNSNSIYNYIQQSLVDFNEETFFKNVYRVPPATTISIFLNDYKKEYTKYWDYHFEESLTEKQSFEKFLYLFEDSVRIRLRSDVEVGSLLSGGLDSSAITLKANKYLEQGISSFSVISNDKSISEEKFIDILIKKANVKCFKLSIEDKDIINNLSKTIFAQGEPFPTFSVVAQFSILEKIKTQSDIKVVLSGQGGDEILLGYLKYYFFYLKNLAIGGKLKRLSYEILGSLFNKTILHQFNIQLAKRYIPFMNKKSFQFLLAEGNNEKIWSSHLISQK
ncbi:MAG: asparagine synthase (glutamine-hydrolyzing), partial [Ignavibacteriaceae bacterium]|nr:asparagine synthase (glutamine-hydrolyzing) [Ignavibacteriaceae bacterium]